MVSQLNALYGIKDLSCLDYFLCLEVSYQPRGVCFFLKRKYVRELLAKASMHEANSLLSPMITSGNKLFALKGETFDDPTLYRSIVGGLQYTVIT